MLGYLHDPPWIGGVTSGLRPWEQDPPGTFFRWTAGRATFFVPSSATTMTVPLRAVFPGPDGTPVRVEVRDDDRLLAHDRAQRSERLGAGHRAAETLRRPPAVSAHRPARLTRRCLPSALGVMTGEVRCR